MFDSAGSSWWTWHFENLVSRDFDWKFGYVACCSQICATSADWQAKTEASWSQSRTFLLWKPRWKLFKKHNYRWRDMGLQLWCRNKSPVFTMLVKIGHF
jgi:hypothetical protein